MADPLVCAIMLTKDRPEMARRAVESFRAQTYGRFSVLVYDTSEKMPTEYPDYGHPSILYHHRGKAEATIGALRNEAIEFASIAKQPKEFDIILHADDDDVSHPDRIAEQVELLQSSGADCVGYNEVLFWRTPQEEAWIYRSPRMSPAIGSSLCYWRSTWERRPFADAPKAQGATSEYYEWLRHCKVVASTGLRHRLPGSLPDGSRFVDMNPRLICSIHGGNTQCYDIEALLAQGSREWTRAQGLDAYTRKVMTL